MSKHKSSRDDHFLHGFTILKQLFDPNSTLGRFLEQLFCHIHDLPPPPPPPDPDPDPVPDTPSLIDLSTLDALIGTAANTVDETTIQSESGDDYTALMYSEGYLVPLSDANGIITGFQFTAPAGIAIDVIGTIGSDIITTANGDNNVNGRAGNDTIYTGIGADTLHGGDGHDKLYGEDGDDMLYGDAGNDTLYGGVGSDTLYGGADSDTLYGGADNDMLYGEDSSDFLYGEAGDDRLSGGAGTDQLTGGTGADTFVFSSDSLGSGVDTVQDFSIAEADKIDLSDVLTAYDSLTDVITDFVRITTSGSNSIVAVDVDGGGDNFQNVALILNNTGLTDEQALVTGGTLIA